MPHYFVTTTDGPSDDEGVHASGLAALSALLRQTLAEIMRDEGALAGKSEFAAEAMDESGQSVMSAKISFSVTS